ncbi:MAG: hypothetical protein ABF628_04935, partial [Acetobacter orientalis]|uniref:hypothetical protein n=1 Tax=Acetobacter orientalis TaxID=146474 RepID=UPI0039ED7775
ELVDGRHAPFPILTQFGRLTLLLAADCHLKIPSGKTPVWGYVDIRHYFLPEGNRMLYRELRFTPAPAMERS